MALRLSWNLATGAKAYIQLRVVSLFSFFFFVLWILSRPITHLIDSNNPFSLSSAPITLLPPASCPCTMHAGAKLSKRPRLGTRHVPGPFLHLMPTAVFARGHPARRLASLLVHRRPLTFLLSCSPRPLGRDDLLATAWVAVAGPITAHYTPRLGRQLSRRASPPARNSPPSGRRPPRAAAARHAIRVASAAVARKGFRWRNPRRHAALVSGDSIDTRHFLSFFYPLISRVVPKPWSTYTRPWLCSLMWDAGRLARVAAVSGTSLRP